MLIDIYYDTGSFPFDITPFNLTSLNTYMGMYSSFVYFSSPMQVKLASSAFLNFLARNLEGRKLAHDADNLTQFPLKYAYFSAHDKVMSAILQSLQQAQYFSSVPPYAS